MNAPQATTGRAEGRDGARVLIVDDDTAVLRSYGRLLSAYGYAVQTAGGGFAALDAVRGASFDVVLSDLDMPGMSGVELLRRVRALDGDLPLVLVTGHPTLPSATAAVAEGALRYLTKPVESKTLVEVVEEATRQRRAATARREALARAEELSGGTRALARSFDAALSSLFMHYQPIVSWQRRALFGYEALLRTREPALPHPGAVLDAAERLGRMDDLGRAVRAKATGPMLRAPADVSLFVNLHARDLLDEELFADDSPLAQIASAVVLEITERAPLDDVRDAKTRVGRLRAMGFRIAVDDLGAGYAGLTTLALLEPEIVKLDMSLVRGLDSRPTHRVVVRTLMSMCRELGALVVAEGVETVGERDALATEGCDLMQGYLFAKPGEAFPTVAL